MWLSPEKDHLPFRQPAQASTPAERKNSPSVETWPRLSMGVNQAGGGSWVIYPDLPTVLVKTPIPYIHPDMSSPCRIPPPLIPITKKNGPEDSNACAVCRGPTAVCAVGPSEGWARVSARHAPKTRRNKRIWFDTQRRSANSGGTRRKSWSTCSAKRVWLGLTQASGVIEMPRVECRILFKEENGLPCSICS